MTKFACTVLFVMTATPVFAESTDDHEQVKALPARFCQAWVMHDGNELAKIMSPNIDFVNVGAIWTHGRDVAIYHDRILKGRFRVSTITPLATSTNFIRRDMAVIRWSWRIDGEQAADGKPQPTRYGLMTMIAEKYGKHWLVTNAQNTNAGPARSEADGLEIPIMVPRQP